MKFLRSAERGRGTRIQLWSACVVIISAFLLPKSAEAFRNLQPRNSGVLPLLLRGEQLPALLGQSPLKLSAFSCHEGTVRSVLFQVDEVNADGRVIPSDASDRVAKDEQPGIIDANDEIILMVRDLGEACPPAQLDRVKGTLVAVQAEAEYLEGPGFVYLLLGERGFMPSTPLVKFDPSRQLVVTNGYTWGYRTDIPFLYDRMGYADTQGRSQEDLLDRVKVRFDIRAVGSLVSLKMNEEQIEAHLDGMRLGPLRATREITVFMKPVPGLSVKAQVSFRHYERFWEARVNFRMPGAATVFLSSMDVSFIHDFLDLRGIRLSTSGLPEGTLIDGKMIAQERQLILTGEQPWFMINGLGLNQLTIVEYDHRLKLEPEAIFVDSEAEKDPPEESPGGLPLVGFRLKNWQDLKAEAYTFGARIAALQGFPEGGGNGFYKALHAPIQITVTNKQQ